jgi:histidine triad (HIT) family protein
MDCIFCKIITGEVPCHKVFEDEETLAFLDVKPHSKGHTIVIPKRHVMTTFDLEELELQELMKDVQTVMQKLGDVVAPDGYNVGWNHGTAGGQVVPHLHIHIFPRYNNDGGGSMHSIVKNPGPPVDEVAKLFE